MSFHSPFLLALDRNTISKVWVTGPSGYGKDIWKFKVQTNTVNEYEHEYEYNNSYRMLKALKNKTAEVSDSIFQNFYFIPIDWREISIETLQVYKNIASLQYR